MPTLQDILSQNDPETLRKLLGRNSSSVDDQQEEILPEAIPSPHPVPPAPQAPSPIGMGPMANIQDYKPSVLEQTEQQPEPIKEVPVEIPTSEMSSSMSTVRSSQPTSVSPEMVREPASEGFTENTVENLRKAQAESQRLKDAADLRNIAALGARSMSAAHGSKPADISDVVKMNEQQKKDSESLIEDFQARGEKEKNDPDSAASNHARTLARAMMKQAGLGINIPDNVSAADLEKRFPQLQQMAISKENRDARSIEAAQRAEDRKLTKEMMFDRNEKTQAARALTQGARQVQTAGGVRGNQLRSRLDQANNIFATMGVDANFTAKDVDAIDPKTLDSKNKLQIVEGAIELNKLLSGAGVPAQATLEKLVPKNVKMDATNVMDYMTSKLNPREQGQFIKDILKVTARARDYAKAENTKLSQGAVASMALAKKHYPEEYEQFLQANNLIDTGEYLKGKDQKESSGQTGQDPDIMEYANAHFKGDYSKAEAYLRKRGDIK